MHKHIMAALCTRTPGLPRLEDWGRNSSVRKAFFWDVAK